MILTQHTMASGPRWALDGMLLEKEFTLSRLLFYSRPDMAAWLLPTNEPAPSGALFKPIEPYQEVWASGVTYRRSLVEREAESAMADVYARVYEAQRPEIFFKSLGHRAVGHGQKVRIRKDSAWNVPEPELVLIVNRQAQIVGYTAGNDVSSRSIEGENPLYLPQAKCYDFACGLGPGIVLTDNPGDVSITLSIIRKGHEVFGGEANTSQMRRPFAELVEYLVRETIFNEGVFLMTGTGIVPGPDFTLQAGDRVTIVVGELTLTNDVA